MGLTEYLGKVKFTITVLTGTKSLYLLLRFLISHQRNEQEKKGPRTRDSGPTPTLRHANTHTYCQKALHSNKKKTQDWTGWLITSLKQIGKINFLYLHLELNRGDKCGAEEQGAKGGPEQAPGSERSLLTQPHSPLSRQRASISIQSLFLRYNSEVFSTD